MIQRRAVQLSLASALLALAGPAPCADPPASAPRSTPAAASAPRRIDPQMLQLATLSGCMACHGIDPGSKTSDGRQPVGPAWAEVAAKYKGDASAAARLAQIVRQGSDPLDTHWRGKVSGLAMPEHAVAISEVDAQYLVHWILNLDN